LRPSLLPSLTAQCSPHGSGDPLEALKDKISVGGIQGSKVEVWANMA